jgi:hypothetical protein
MAQEDYFISNSAGAVVRAEINGTFEAIATQNSGPVAPGVTFSNMWWYDESTGLLKRRNSANTAWVTFVSTAMESVINAATLAAARTAFGLSDVSQAEAEAGVATTLRAWTAQRVAQAILAQSAYDLTFFAGWSYDMSGENLVVRAYTPPLILLRDVTFSSPARGSIGTAAVGAAAIVDIKLNENSIYSVKPNFADGLTTFSPGTLSTTQGSAGDTIAFHVSQIGSSTAGQKVVFGLPAKTR